MSQPEPNRDSEAFLSALADQLSIHPDQISARRHARAAASVARSDRSVARSRAVGWVAAAVTIVSVLGTGGVAVAGGLAPPIQSVVADLARALPVPFDVPYPASAAAVASTESVTAANNRPRDEGLIAEANADDDGTDSRPATSPEMPDLASIDDSTVASDERPPDDDERSGDGCDLRGVWGDEVSLDADEVENLRADVLQNCGFDILRPPPWARDRWGDDRDQRPENDGRFDDDSDDDDRGERGRDSREGDDDDRSTDSDDSDSTGSERIDEPTDRGDDEQEESPDHIDPTENGETNGSPDDERRESRD